jgi:hypothetical protein
MRISLSKEVFEAAMNLIATRPLKEVIQLWKEIQRDMQMVEEKENDKPVDDTPTD